MPFIFYKYGKRIRDKSKFAPAPDIAPDKRRDEEANTESRARSEVMSDAKEEE